MWKEAALDKINSSRGSLTFKTQREINVDQEKKMEEFDEKLSKLRDLNIRFHEISIVEIPTYDEARVN
ncbi:hypothetical protein [Exiguobacterium aurantiacum]|uniref:hypothetical protein n=1 Tax=Exiguobacterium aurantiacum TaxID=33987 RepID=UPI00087795C4|nr:hypothetical protein [Exiguobacterium aurantiacum]